MKVTKQELQEFGLYDSLPQTLKEMADGDYFVFYYKVDEEMLLSEEDLEPVHKIKIVA